MRLAFGLGHPDVLPFDLGCRATVRHHYDRPDLPNAGDLHALAQPWRPYRTFATWYLWRSGDADPRVGIQE